MPDKLTITFLGTSSAPPQIERRQSGVFINYRNEHILVDAGEAIQSQMLKYKVSFAKKLTILITHLHSDHTLGIIGLLSTRCFYGVHTPVTIIGPPWTTSFIFLQMLAYRLYPDYDVKVIETSGGVVYSNPNIMIKAFPTNHLSTSLGYTIQTHVPLGKFNVDKARQLGIEEGKLWGKLKKGFTLKIGNKTYKPSDVLDELNEKKLKVVITGDTYLSQEVINNAVEADLLIHDATYPPDEEARARKYKHTTCLQAAQIAKLARVKRLILTHISTLYSNKEKALEQVQKIFPNTNFAYDGLRIILPSAKGEKEKNKGKQ